MEALSIKQRKNMLKGVAKAKATIFKLLGNQNRIEILYELYESDKTWTELNNELHMNPKLMRDHLNYLIRYEIVEKRDNIYSLTDLGRDMCELNLGITQKDIQEFYNDR